MSIREEAQAVGDYWRGHPDPEDASTWGGRQSYAEAKVAYRQQAGSPPEPPAVPGPPTPGAGMAAARAGDLLNHGAVIGPVTTGVSTQVFIKGQPVACMGDPYICPMFSGPAPHGSGTIVKGSGTVFVNGKSIARVADPSSCGPPGLIAVGEATVLVGG